MLPQYLPSTLPAEELWVIGYTLLPIPGGSPTDPRRKTLVHVHPSGDELNSVYTASLPILSTPLAFFESALAALSKHTSHTPSRPVVVRPQLFLLDAG